MNAIQSLTNLLAERAELDKTLASKLQKSILQEAIQGHLVPQDPTDEPAEELLKRIHKEKEKLVKEGKLKRKDVVESYIFKGDDNKYYEQINGSVIEIASDFDFPNTWGVVHLADICRLIDGEKRQGRHICLDAKYLRGKSNGEYLDKGKYVIKGDNIILVDGENSGEVFTVPCEGYMGSTFKQLWASTEMHLPFILYFIQFYKDRLRNSKKGAAIPHLNKDIFYNLLIGIPPIEEQERISKILLELYNNL
ncbi:MAG: restriction endonuclease subunit S [Bacteroidales bacterium]|nr:restriction endonuclease subunit S [Bacteroidales bacterium]